MAHGAAAQDRPRGAGYGIVVAESFHGHGSVSAPVRRNAKGRLEVGLPGGTWFECAFSCSDTLRRQAALDAAAEITKRGGWA